MLGHYDEECGWKKGRPPSKLTRDPAVRSSWSPGGQLLSAQHGVDAFYDMRRRSVELGALGLPHRFHGELRTGIAQNRSVLRRHGIKPVRVHPPSDAGSDGYGGLFATVKIRGRSNRCHKTARGHRREGSVKMEITLERGYLPIPKCDKYGSSRPLGFVFWSSGSL